MKAALVGHPQSGKSTLFRLLTGADPPASRQHEDHLGVVRVPDDRLRRLSDLFQPKKTTLVAHELIDPAAPFPAVGAREPREPAADRDPYAALRTADLLVVVLRAFADPAIPHPSGSIDSERDRARIQEEMALADLVVVEGRLERIDKLAKVGKKAEAPGERALLARLHDHLGAGRPLRELGLSREEAKAIRGYGFLSHKPVLLLYNIGEGEAPTAAPTSPESGTKTISLAARAELEISTLAPEEQAAFRAELGFEEPGLSRVIRAAERALGSTTFFTAGPPEARAWQVPTGSSVVEAAGKIHTDLARGFIRCEVVSWDRLVEAGSWAGARERGWMRTEGREYQVREGDVLLVLFKV